MKFLLFGLSLALTSLGLAQAGDTHPKGTSAEVSLDAIKRKLADAEAAARAESQKAGPATADQDRKALALARNLEETRAALFADAVAFAAAHPNSEASFGALDWVLATNRSYDLPAGAAALELVTQQYAAEPKIGALLSVLTYYFPDADSAARPPALSLLKAVMAQNPDRTARGHAALGLAWLAKKELRTAELRGNAAELARVTAATEQAFELVAREYGDCPNLRKVGVSAPQPTLGGEAEAELRELRYLAIGKVAPEIEGKDLGGEPMKLSAARGKVVLLVFWAAWCGPCMAAVPHEKELVERFKGRPFVLIGVNGDGSTAAASEAVRKHQIPWRSFWNGPKGPAGGIAAAWNVRGWPTVYVLDERGVIREKYLAGNKLDAPLEKLVRAAEQAP